MAAFWTAGVQAQCVPAIEVNGSATVYVVPDRITVEIAMEEYFKHDGADSIKVKVTEIERQVRKTLADTGVEDSSISVSDVGNYRNSAVASKFLMAKRLSVVLTDFRQLDMISGNLPQLGIAGFQITGLDNSEMEKYNRQGLKAALDAARDKAEFIALNENLSIVVPIEIVESGNSYYDSRAFSNSSFSGGSGMEDMRKISRRYSVKVRYTATSKSKEE